MDRRLPGARSGHGGPLPSVSIDVRRSGRTVRRPQSAVPDTGKIVRGPVFSTGMDRRTPIAQVAPHNLLAAVRTGSDPTMFPHWSVTRRGSHMSLAAAAIVALGLALFTLLARVEIPD